MISTKDILYSIINPVKPRSTWALLVKLYTRRLVWCERGLRLVHYDDDTTTIIYNKDLPVGMTQDNYHDYQFIRGQIVHNPLKKDHTR
jgi:hypothetical protein